MTEQQEEKGSLKDQLEQLFRQKAKFAMTSGVATAVDYFIYLFLVGRFFSPVVSNVISYGIAMVLNFLLQKRFVFDLRRSSSRAFLLAMAVSMGGLVISTLIVWLLSKWDFFSTHQYITKIIATGMVFFYNFYFKRYVFEKRFFSVD